MNSSHLRVWRRQEGILLPAPPGKLLTVAKPRCRAYGKTALASGLIFFHGYLGLVSDSRVWQTLRGLLPPAAGRPLWSRSGLGTRSWRGARTRGAPPGPRASQHRSRGQRGLNERLEGIAAERACGGIALLSPGNRPDATQKKKKKSPLKKRIVLRIHRSKREREAGADSALEAGARGCGAGSPRREEAGTLVTPLQGTFEHPGRWVRGRGGEVPRAGGRAGA